MNLKGVVVFLVVADFKDSQLSIRRDVSSFRHLHLLPARAKNFLRTFPSHIEIHLLIKLTSVYLRGVTYLLITTP